MGILSPCLVQYMTDTPGADETNVSGRAYSLSRLSGTDGFQDAWIVQLWTRTNGLLCLCWYPLWALPDGLVCHHG
jgi:hypothetical protein